MLQSLLSNGQKNNFTVFFIYNPLVPFRTGFQSGNSGGEVIFSFLLIAMWVFGGAWNQAVGQTLDELSLTEAYQLFETNYPSLQNSAVLEQIYQEELTQLDIAKLPSIFLKGDARLQSESVRLDAEGVPLPFEINQPLVAINHMRKQIMWFWMEG